MIDRLFAYGTLRSGETKTHLLAHIGGRCIEAPLIGFHFPSGYGVTESDPVLAPSLASQPIAGLVFEAEFTIGQWQIPDDFEADTYQKKWPR